MPSGYLVKKPIMSASDALLSDALLSDVLLSDLILIRANCKEILVCTKKYSALVLALLHRVVILTTASWRSFTNFTGQLSSLLL